MVPTSTSPPLSIPTPTTAFSLTFHSTASSIYKAVSPYLRHNQDQQPSQADLSSHVVWSHILKLVVPAADRSPASSSSDSDETMSPSLPFPEGDSLWIACWNDGAQQLECIVSATHGPVAHHPIFIVPIGDILRHLPPDAINQRMERIASELSSRDLGERVYSVFAPKALAERFATAWAVEAEASLSDDPQDAVDLMHSHRRDFRSTARLPDIPNHRLRRARGHDLDDVALLCEKYSNTTPYSLTFADARREAKRLIQDKAMYVYEVVKADGTPQIVSITAAGRSTTTVTAITKTYTLPEFEKRGFSSRLLGFACRKLFENPAQQAVISYIPKGNTAARTIFERTGFTSVPGPWTEWLECGFPDAVQGQW